MKQKQILNILLLGSVITIILNDFIFNETPEIFSFGNKLGSILSNLSLSYIASYIFYLVVVVTKEKNDKKNIYFSVYGWTNQLVGRAYVVYNEIITASSTAHTVYDKKTITKDEFIDLCKIANPNAISPNTTIGLSTNPQLASYGKIIYNDSFLNVKGLTDKIFNYMPFLDSEFVRLINRLHSSTFFMLAPILNLQTRNTDFSAYAEDMYEFLQFVLDLDLYNETNNKIYQNKQ